MSVVRRLTQLVGIAAVLALGTALILDATGVTTRAWRDDVADGFRDVALPGTAEWATALIGLGLGILGLVLLVAQLVPSPSGGHRRHEVHTTTKGDTHIRGRAVIGSVRRTVEEIEHVRSADVRWTGKAVDVELLVDDDANLDEVERAARAALDHGFWIDLGVADVGVNLLVVHELRRDAPPKVR